ncbi:MAG: hypothetical protein E7233_13965 [Lachnospiraceae bacterium]|nr:hypothetical protein [Lachnospiraceae bacterium]
MNARQKLHQAHLAEWAARFSDQKASGLTVRQWCEQNQISIHKYNYWKHLLKEEVVDQMLPDIVPLSLTASRPSVRQKTSVSESPAVSRTNRTIRANNSNPNVRLCIDGVALELESSIPEDFLRTLIRAVHYA